MEVMVRKGVKFTLSDDSHGPNDVGMHYDKLHAYAKENGIRTVYCPRKSGSEIVYISIDL